MRTRAACMAAIAIAAATAAAPAPGAQASYGNSSEQAGADFFLGVLPAPGAQASYGNSSTAAFVLGSHGTPDASWLRPGAQYDIRPAFALGSGSAGMFDRARGVSVGPSGQIAVADTGNHLVHIFHPDGTLAFRLGSNGAGDGEFRGPLGVSVGPSGQIAVADTGNDRVQVFHSNGTFAFSFGSSGTGDGQFYRPSGVSVGPSGQIAVSDHHNDRARASALKAPNALVLDHRNDRVQVFHPNGTFAFSFGSHGAGDGQFDGLGGVSIGPSGMIAAADTDNDRVQVFHPNGTFAFKFGSRGAGDGQFRYPYAVSVGPSGMIAVADYHNDRVQVFGPNGTFAFALGPPGADDGKFWFPLAVSVGPSGMIAAADHYNDHVQVFHPNGTFAFKFGAGGTAGGQFLRPTGVAIGPSGMIAAADTGNDRVQVFHPNGTFALEFGSRGAGDGQFDAVIAVAIGPSGIIAAADTGNDRVQVFHPNGTFALKFGSSGTGDGQFRNPTGVAIGPSGMIAVTDRNNHRVQVFHPNGTFAFKFGPGPGYDNNRLSGIAVGPSGAIAATEHDGIRVFYPNGTFAFKFGSNGTGDGEFSRAHGMAVGPSGAIAVADYYNDRVQVFHPNGTFALKFGSSGTGDGEFRRPTGVAISPSGQIAVAEYANNRVQVFRLNGTDGGRDAAPPPAPDAAARPAAVSSVYSPDPGGMYGEGAAVAIHVAFDRPVAVTGSPLLLLDAGGAGRPAAAYASGNGTAELLFLYTVRPGDSAADLGYASGTALRLNGGSIRDSAGRAADVGLPPPGSRDSLSHSSDVRIDAVAPSVLGVSTLPPPGAAHGAGRAIEILVRFDEPVSVSTAHGAPVLALTAGGRNGSAAAYAGASPGAGDSLSFYYLVRPGDGKGAMSYRGAGALYLNGSVIADAAGNAANLTLPARGSPGHLGDVAIDAVQPRVVSVSSPSPGGTHVEGSVVNITVTFSEPVAVAWGAPTLGLNVGSAYRYASYASGSGTHALSFLYAVQIGDFSDALGYAGTNSLAGIIADMAGNAANLTLPPPGSPASLSGSRDITVYSLGIRPDFLDAVWTRSAADGAGGFDMLGGAMSVDAFGMGGGTYAVVASSRDDGVQLIRVHANGTLEPAGSARDGLGGFDALGGAADVRAFAMGGQAYAMAASPRDDGVQLIRVHGNGTLEPAGSARDGLGGFDALGGAAAVDVFTAGAGGGGGGQAYAIAASPRDDGVQLIRVHENGTLEPAGSARDGLGGFDALGGAADVRAFAMGGQAYAMAASPRDDGVQLIRVHGNGTLEPAGSARDGLGGFDALGGAAAVDAFHAAGGSGRTYAMAASPGDRGVQLIRVHGDGTLAPADSARYGQNGFAGLAAAAATPAAAADIDAFDIGNRTYAITPSAYEGVQMISVHEDGTLAPAGLSYDYDFRYAGISAHSAADVFGRGNQTYAIVTSYLDSAVHVLWLEPRAPGALPPPPPPPVRLMPTVTGVTSPDADGLYTAGDGIRIAVAFTRNVTVTAPIQLRLNADSTAAAAYASGNGTSELTFLYTVRPGDAAADLDYAGAGALQASDTAGAGRPSYMIRDGVVEWSEHYPITSASGSGYPAYIRLPAPASPGSLGASKDIAVDAVPPRVASVGPPASAAGPHSAGSVVRIAVSFTERVVVAAAAADRTAALPHLELNASAGRPSIAAYESGNGTGTLLFAYAVQPGDADGPLAYAGARALRLNGSSVADAAGNAADLRLPAPGAPHSLSYSAGIVLDTRAPSVAGVSSPAALNATLRAGDTAAIHVRFDEPVLVTAARGQAPSMLLALGNGSAGGAYGTSGAEAATRHAPYSGGNGTDTLSFLYTARAGDYSDGLSYAGAGALSPNGAAVVDAAGNPASLALPAPGSPGSLSRSASISIDGVRPAVAGVSASNASTALSAGDSVRINVRFTEPVVVAAATGWPSLLLAAGGGNGSYAPALYLEGNGTDTLSFLYTAQIGDYSDDLSYAGAGALSPNGAAVVDAAGNPASLALPAPGSPGSLSRSASISIDGVRPAVAGVSASNASTALSAGDSVRINVRFTEPVVVAAATGWPSLLLAAGGGNGSYAPALYLEGNGTDTLSFLYTAQIGDYSDDLSYAGAGALSPNGAAVADAAGNPASLALPAPGSPGSLSHGADIRVRAHPVAVDDPLQPRPSPPPAPRPGPVAPGMIAVADTNNSRIQAFHPNGTFAFKFGSNGRGDGQFSNPEGIAFGPSGRIAVADTHNDRIQAFHPNGTFAFKFGSNGKGDGQLDRPHGIASGPSGAMAVADTHNDRIQVFHPNGTFAFKFGSNGKGDGQFSNPEGIAFGPSGRIAVADTHNDRIQVFHPNGTFAFKLDSHGLGNGRFYKPDGVAFGPSGQIAVVELSNARIQVFYPNGTPGFKLDYNDFLFEDPVSVAFGPSGAMAVVDQYDDSILVYRPDGASAFKFGSYGHGDGQFNWPEGVAIYAGPGRGGPASDADADATAAAPRVLGVGAAVPDGTYPAGSTIRITAEFDGPVVISGAALPELALNVGAAPRPALYESGNGTAALVFAYTVGAGDRADDLGYAGTGALSGSIAGRDGGPASLALPAPGSQGSLSHSASISIDGVRPSVAEVSASMHNGTVRAGGSVTIAVLFGEPVHVEAAPGGGNSSSSGGAPSLSLAVGDSGQGRAVPYSGGSGTQILSFLYTARTGDYSDGLSYDGAGALSPNGALVRDAAGNPANLTLPAPGSPGSLSHGADIKVRAHPVAVEDPPTPERDDPAPPGTPPGAEEQPPPGTPPGAEEQPPPGTPPGAEEQPPPGTPPGAEEQPPPGTPPGAEEQPPPGTPPGAEEQPPPGTPPGAEEQPPTPPTVDPPAVTSVSSAPAAAAYRAGQAVDILVHFDGPVRVDTSHGAPALALDTGRAGGAPAARYAGGSNSSGSNTLAFSYAVQQGDRTADLSYAGTDALSLNGSLVTGGTGAAATTAAAAALTLPYPGKPGSLSHSADIVLDTDAPAVAGVSASVHNGTGEAGGTVRAGGSVTIAVLFGEPVHVEAAPGGGGTPALSLAVGDNGQGRAAAPYSGGSGTRILSFLYTARTGDYSDGLSYAGAGALSPNGALVRDAAGNPANLTLPAPGSPGSLSHGADIRVVAHPAVVDGAPPPPAVTGVRAPGPGGGYTAGNHLDIAVSFSEPVTVKGRAYLILDAAPAEDGGGSSPASPAFAAAAAAASARMAEYESGNNTATLVFAYVVRDGDRTGDLSYAGTGALLVGEGGSITAAASAARHAGGGGPGAAPPPQPAALPANMTLPAPGAPGSLSGSGDIVIDTARPAVGIGLLAEAGPDGSLTPASQAMVQGARAAAAEFNVLRASASSSDPMLNITVHPVLPPLHDGAYRAIAAAHSSGSAPAAYVGPADDAAMHAAQRYAQANGLVVVSPSSSDPSLSAAGDGVFRLAPDGRHASAVLSGMVADSGAGAAVLLVENDVHWQHVGAVQTQEGAGAPAGAAAADGGGGAAAADSPPPVGSEHGLPAALLDDLAAYGVDAQAGAVRFSSFSGGGGGQGADWAAVASRLAAAVDNSSSPPAETAVVYLGSPGALASLAPHLLEAGLAAGTAGWFAAGGVLEAPEFSAGAGAGAADPAAGAAAAAGFARESRLVSIAFDVEASAAGARIDGILEERGIAASRADRVAAYAAHDAAMLLGLSLAHDRSAAGGPTAAGVARASEEDSAGALGDIALDAAGDLRVPSTFAVWKAAPAAGPARQPGLEHGLRTCSLALEKGFLDFGSVPLNRPSRPAGQTILNTGTEPYSSVRLAASPWISAADGGAATLPASITQMRLAGGDFRPLEDGTAVAAGLAYDGRLGLEMRLDLTGHAVPTGIQMQQTVRYLVSC